MPNTIYKICIHKEHITANPQPVTNFRKDKSRIDQLTVYCKDCCKRIAKQYYLTNSEILKEKIKNG